MCIIKCYEEKATRLIRVVFVWHFGRAETVRNEKLKKIKTHFFHVYFLGLRAADADATLLLFKDLVLRFTFTVIVFYVYFPFAGLCSDRLCACTCFFFFFQIKPNQFYVLYISSRLSLSAGNLLLYFVSRRLPVSYGWSMLYEKKR